MKGLLGPTPIKRYIIGAPTESRDIRNTVETPHKNRHRRTFRSLAVEKIEAVRTNPVDVRVVNCVRRNSHAAAGYLNLSGTSELRKLLFKSSLTPHLIAWEGEYKNHPHTNPHRSQLWSYIASEKYADVELNISVPVPEGALPEVPYIFANYLVTMYQVLANGPSSCFPVDPSETKYMGGFSSENWHRAWVVLVHYKKYLGRVAALREQGRQFHIQGGTMAAHITYLTEEDYKEYAEDDSGLSLIGRSGGAGHTQDSLTRRGYYTERQAKLPKIDDRSKGKLPSGQEAKLLSAKHAAGVEKTVVNLATGMSETDDSDVEEQQPITINETPSPIRKRRRSPSIIEITDEIGVNASVGTSREDSPISRARAARSPSILEIFSWKKPPPTVPVDTKPRLETRTATTPAIFQGEAHETSRYSTTPGTSEGKGSETQCHSTTPFIARGHIQSQQPIQPSKIPAPRPQTLKATPSTRLNPQKTTSKPLTQAHPTTSRANPQQPTSTTTTPPPSLFLTPPPSVESTKDTLFSTLSPFPISYAERYSAGYSTRYVSESESPEPISVFDRRLAGHTG